jgi:hypothetical protein
MYALYLGEECVRARGPPDGILARIMALGCNDADCEGKVCVDDALPSLQRRLKQHVLEYVIPVMPAMLTEDAAVDSAPAIRYWHAVRSSGGAVVSNTRRVCSMQALAAHLLAQVDFGECWMRQCS